MASTDSHKDDNVEGYSKKSEGSLVDWSTLCLGSPELRLWTEFQTSCDNENTVAYITAALVFWAPTVRKVYLNGSPYLLCISFSYFHVCTCVMWLREFACVWAGGCMWTNVHVFTRVLIPQVEVGITPSWQLHLIVWGRASWSSSDFMLQLILQVSLFHGYHFCHLNQVRHHTDPAIM